MVLGVTPTVVVGTDGVAVVVVVVELSAVVDVVAGVVVVVDDTSGARPVSGEVQPDGGWLGPDCPGIKTVPAHPMLVRMTSRTTVPPSEKRATESTSRMNPEASTEMASVVPV